MVGTPNGAGRVGGLACALALGAAMTMGPGVAWADTTGPNSSSASSTSTASSGEAASAGSNSHPKRKRSGVAVPTGAARTGSTTTGKKARGSTSTPATTNASGRRDVTAPKVTKTPTTKTPTTKTPTPRSAPTPTSNATEVAAVTPTALRDSAVPATTPRSAANPVAGLVRQIVTAFTSALDGMPSAAGSPAAPTPSPALWGVLAWVRREFEQTDRRATTAPVASISAAAAVSPTATVTTLPTITTDWLTGQQFPNYTQDNFGISGTDLGIMWDNGIADDPNTPEDEHQVLIAFGDTFGPNSTNWRQNVLLRSSDPVLWNGMYVGTGSTTDPYAGSPLASDDYSKTLIYNTSYLAGSRTQASIIPTSGIAVANPDGTVRQYMSFMSVRKWGSPGHWTTNYSAVAYSDDNGQNWTIAPTSIRSAAVGRSISAYVSGNQNFQMGAFVNGGDGYVYDYGTPSGRSGTLYLSRVSEDDILDKTKYEYWTGSSWVVNKPSAAKPILPPATTSFFGLFTRTVNPTVGEMSVQYNQYLDEYVMLYGDSANNMVMRTSDTPEGNWSAPIILATAAQYPQLYAPMIDPWSSTDLLRMGDGVTPEDPRYLFWNMSMFGQYNVMSMRTDLQPLLSTVLV